MTIIHYYLALFFTWVLDIPLGGYDATIFDHDKEPDMTEETGAWDSLNARK